jgi:PAS domain-containing protein
MPQIVWTARPDGTIDYFNERWYQFAECSRDDDPEQTWRSIVHPDDLQRHQDVWANSVRSGAPFEIEIRLIERKTGRHRWFLFRAIAGTDAAGDRHALVRNRHRHRRPKKEPRRASDQRGALPQPGHGVAGGGVYHRSDGADHALQRTRGRVMGTAAGTRQGSLVRILETPRPDGTPLPLDQCPMAVTLREGRGVRGEELIIERPDGSRVHVLPHPEPSAAPRAKSSERSTWSSTSPR